MVYQVIWLVIWLLLFVLGACFGVGEQHGAYGAFGLCIASSLVGFVCMFVIGMWRNWK